MLPIQLLSMILILGHSGSILQKLTVFRLGNNVSLEKWAIVLDAMVCTSCLLVYYCITDWNVLREERVSDFCSETIAMTEEEIDEFAHMSTLRHPPDSAINYKSVICLQIVVMVASVFSMARRTALLGPTLTLLIFMLGQIVKFLVTFGLIFGIYLLISDLLSAELRSQSETIGL